MPYDHSTKIGNEGDLVKHIVLAACVRQLLANATLQFAYAESHAARAEYILPEGGSWKDGIGLLANVAASQRTRHVKWFYDEFLTRRCRVGGRYLGSHAIAFSLAGERKPLGCQFFLYDHSQAVVDDLHRSYHPWTPGAAVDHRTVEITQGDGYEGVRARLGDQTSQPDLVVIDPDSLGQVRQVKDLLTALADEGVGFVCWTPRSASVEATTQQLMERDEFYEKLKDSAAKFGMKLKDMKSAVADTLGGSVDRLSVDVQQARESNESQRFREWATKRGFGVHSAKWKPWISSRATSGCQITVSENLKDVAAQVIDDLRAALRRKSNWELTTP